MDPIDVSVADELVAYLRKDGAPDLNDLQDPGLRFESIFFALWWVIINTITRAKRIGGTTGTDTVGDIGRRQVGRDIPQSWLVDARRLCQDDLSQQTAWSKRTYSIRRHVLYRQCKHNIVVVVLKNINKRLFRHQ